MTTGRVAADLIYDAAVKLLLSYDTASPERKADISRSLTGLYSEYARVTGQPNLLNANYKDLRSSLSKASGSLKRIRANADSLKNNLVRASEIITAVTGVLSLIS
jgi:hypothetical protein